jgi:transcriptional regulator with XRE-family HTH domain
LPSPPPLSKTEITRNVLVDDKGMEKILQLMLSRSGLTLKEAADVMGMHVESLRQYLNGNRPNPSIKWLARFAEHCNCKIQIKWL